MGQDDLSVFTPQEVTKHNTLQDLWVILDGTVYNVTDFVSKHPGGKSIIMEFAGQDATEAFEDIGHSSDARNILKSLVIGRLKSKKVHRKNSILLGIALGLTTVTLAILAGYYLNRGYLGPSR